MKTVLIILALVAMAGTTQAQSLLTEQPETPAQQSAREVLAAPAQTRDAILAQLNDAFARLWDAPDPQEVLDAMGTRAGKVFAINTKFAQVVGTLLTEEGDTEGLARFSAIMAKIKPHTINPDGTVTLIVDPSP